MTARVESFIQWYIKNTEQRPIIKKLKLKRGERRSARERRGRGGIAKGSRRKERAREARSTFRACKSELYQESLLWKLTNSQELKGVMYTDKAFAKALPEIEHIKKGEGEKEREGKGRVEDFSEVSIKRSKKRARWMNRGHILARTLLTHHLSHSSSI